MMVRDRSYMRGLRSHSLPAFLRATAWECGLNIEITEEKGWIRTTVFYEVYGEQSNVDRFNAHIQRTLDDRNHES